MARIDTLEEESLFSLEVVVDTLALGKNVACRFPAVAFRLLDFPTLLVYHVEPELGGQIKLKINADPYYKLPCQLSELQDRHGKFLVKKGKSCLFKVAPNTIRGHLHSTPLYVMLIDTFPEVPKLIASCTVPLDSCIDEVYDDICKLGLSVPSTHGEKGEYDLCNLMGKDIGCVSLGVRILSLGVGLLPHIPESSVSKLKKKGVVSTATAVEKKTDKSDDVTLYDLDTLDKDVQVSILPEQTRVEDFQGQTDQNPMPNVATQTFKSKEKRSKRTVQLARPMVQDEIDDYFVTNAECPPPLFFNSEMEMKTSQSLLLSHYPMGLSSQRSHDESESDDDIRDEDIFSDPEIDEKKLFKTPKKEFVQKLAAPPKKPPPQQMQGSLAQLPILNALLQEIICLQGGQQTDGHPDLKLKQVIKKLPTHTPLSPRRVKLNQETPRPVSPGRKHFDFPKESQEDFLSRIASPRRAPPGKPEPRPGSPLGMRKHICQAAQAEPQTQTITKNKGWLRNHPSAGGLRTKIQPGMTHTQKLRLAKTNPQLLETLEKEEQNRVQKRRELMQKKWGSQQFLSSTGMADVSTEITRHHLKDTGNVNVPSLDLSGISDTRHHKKPVPTPRHSVSNREFHDALDAEVPPVTPRPRRSKQKRDDLAQMIPEKDIGSSVKAEYSSNSEQHSSRIEVHIPSASAHDDYASDATSANDSELASPRPRTRIINKTKTMHNPGFPTGDSQELSDMVPYSDDFDPSSVIDTSKIRRIIHEFSDTDEEDTRHQTTLEGISAGDELGLRCIVDKFSDEDTEKSDRSKSGSYRSAASNLSANDAKNKLAIPQVPKPSTSVYSPDTMNESHGSRQPALATRQPFTAISVTDALSNTQDSTAYLNRSQVISQVSLDSANSDSLAERRRPTRSVHPKPSPRTPRTPRNISVRTDSISSYAPSDPENTSPISPGGGPDGNYSDSFEDYSEDDEESEILVKPKQMKDLHVDPKAKLGYTWGY